MHNGLHGSRDPGVPHGALPRGPSGQSALGVQPGEFGDVPLVLCHLLPERAVHPAIEVLKAAKAGQPFLDGRNPFLKILESGRICRIVWLKVVPCYLHQDVGAFAHQAAAGIHYLRVQPGRVVVLGVKVDVDRYGKHCHGHDSCCGHAVEPVHVSRDLLDGPVRIDPHAHHGNAIPPGLYNEHVLLDLRKLLLVGYGIAGAVVVAGYDYQL